MCLRLGWVERPTDRRTPTEVWRFHFGVRWLFDEVAKILSEDTTFTQLSMTKKMRIFRKKRSKAFCLRENLYKSLFVVLFVYLFF